MPLSLTNPYSQAFLSRPALRMQRRIALGVALLLVACMGSLLPVAGFPLGGVPSFLPMVYVAMALCNGFTSLLLGLQALHLRHATLALLAGAYTLMATTCIIQLATSPELIGMAGSEGLQAWAWMGWTGRVAFPLFVMLAIIQKDTARKRRSVFALWLLPAFIALVVFSVLQHVPHLPHLLVTNEGPPKLAGFLTHWILPGDLLLVCGAATMLARKSRFRTRLHLWLGVAMVGMFGETILAMWAESRFTIGWYGAVAFNLMTILTLLVALLWDIHDIQGTLQRMNAQLHRQANHDALTGLLLRRPFNDFMSKAQSGRKPGEPSPVLLMIDIDDFKAYNDAFGHLSGDSCLTSIGRALQDLTHLHQGCIARMGGEEMAVLLSGRAAAHPEVIAESLRREVEMLHLQHAPGARMPWVTVSIGWARAGRGKGLAAWYKQADDALYAAKAAGRNRVMGATLPAGSAGKPLTGSLLERHRQTGTLPPLASGTPK